MSQSMDERLERRKLDALKRGVHRMGKDETLPVATHVIGIGAAGAGAIAEILRSLAPDAPKFTALAIDIGDGDLAALQALADTMPPERAEVIVVPLEVPPRDELFGTLRRYREFLKLEYPRYYWNPNYEPWLASTVDLPAAGGHFKRAVSKAVYGSAYYNEPRALEAKLRAFVAGVDASRAQNVVAVVFGLGGGTGSGIVVDLARHVSNVMFGRRVLVVGVAILPCDGDVPEHRGAAIFPALNELDCMGDQPKNEGVITVWGDLYRNPFTGGVILVPQQPVWERTRDLAATHAKVDAEIASFLVGGGGKHLWETLRLLNWVGAPPTQHQAARTQYGPKWAHMLGFVDAGAPIADASMLRQQMGLRPTYAPEFFELRAPAGSAAAQSVATALAAEFNPKIEPSVLEGATSESVQFVLPCVSKIDLDVFFDSRDVYDREAWDGKLAEHSWLLDLGVMLCEPAIRFEGMAGECLWGCACWVVVPYDDIRGPGRQTPTLEAPVAAKLAPVAE